MNRENVITLAEKSFGEVQNVKESLYKGVIKIDNKEAGRYYLDFNTNINTIGFDDYQEDLLGDEYYTLPDTLKWNLYLFLLCDSVSYDVKERIEKNHKYARKYVFDEFQFEDFLKINKSATGKTFNIISKLKKKLDDSELNEVYGKQSMTLTVDNFLTDKVIKGGSIFQPNVANLNPDKIDTVDRIILHPSYRDNPKDPKEFNFGKVNLFTGINGVGKTTILEAIELMICGRTLRNEKNEEPNCIEAYFNKSILEHKYSTESKKYLARDSAWYSTSYTRDNTMYNSFNRYNFFNSDSAFSFAKSTDEKSIKKALNDLVFGAEYNYIMERARKLFPDFRKENNRIARELLDAENKIIEAKEIIKLKSTQSNVADLEKVIEDNYKQLNFLSKGIVVKTQYTTIEELNNRLQSCIKKLLEKRDFSVSNLATLKSLIVNNENKRRIVKEYIGKQEALLKTISEAEISLKELYLKEQNFNECAKLFTHKSIFDVEALKTNRENNTEKISKHEYADNLLGQVNLTEFKETKYTLTQKINNTKDLLDDKNKELNAVIIEKAALTDQLDRVGTVISEIKALGIEFLILLKNAKECPLCNTEYTYDELFIRINKINEQELNREKIAEFHSKESSLKNDSSILEKERNNLEKIDLLCKKLDIDATMPLSKVIELIVEFQSKKATTLQQKQELDSLESFLETLNFSEAEFFRLKSLFEKLFGDEIPCKYESKELFEAKSRDIQLKIDKAKIRQENLIIEKNRLLVELNTAVETNDNIDSIQKINDIVEERFNTLNEYKRMFDKLKEVIELNDSLFLDHIDLLSTTLQRNINSYKNEMQTQVELDLATKAVEKNDAFIQSNQELSKRLNKAFETLKNFDESDDSDLEEFFRENVGEFLDVFKTIHAPKEFVDIKFQDNALCLIPEKGNPRSVTEISTGQRSALALSLFITLNRKLKNGPNVIMFDDPVSFVDDLNILSFLDYLRFFVLKENKQIFFATANSRLAVLFEKKFEFLGDTDFKKWSLIRNTN